MRVVHCLAVVASLAATALSASSAQHPEHQPVKVDKDKPAATAHSTEHMSGWKELDAYHMVMMRAWHPAKDRNDLAPVRAEATKLADAADRWAAASIPAACDSPANRTGIKGIQADSRALAALVAAGPDPEVRSALAALHERFEVVNRGCKVGHH